MSCRIRWIVRTGYWLLLVVGLGSVIQAAELEQAFQQRQTLLSALQPVPVGLNQTTDLRKVSLRGIEAALLEQSDLGKLPQVVQYLAGLQEIRYVVVDHEQHDIILVGYGEGWKVDLRGTVVGRTTGRPVLLLDDLIVALRAALGNVERITCSIDASEQDLRQVQGYLGTLQMATDLDEAKVASLLCPQKVVVTGVPADSHVARVLAAATLQTKRIGLGQDKPQVQGLPSFVALLPKGGHGLQNLSPRWELAPVYAPLMADADGLVWELPRGSLRCNAAEVMPVTESFTLLTRQWADQLSRKFDLLASKELTFSQLRNCTDLAVVAALITRHDLPAKADYKFSRLTDPAQLRTLKYDVPPTTPGHAKVLAKGTTFVINASAGLQIQPSRVVEKCERVTTLASIATQAKQPPETTSWWWN